MEFYCTCLSPIYFLLLSTYLDHHHHFQKHLHKSAGASVRGCGITPWRVTQTFLPFSQASQRDNKGNKGIMCRESYTQGTMLQSSHKETKKFNAEVRPVQDLHLCRYLKTQDLLSWALHSSSVTTRAEKGTIIVSTSQGLTGAQCLMSTGTPRSAWRISAHPKHTAEHGGHLHHEESHGTHWK